MEIAVCENCYIVKNIIYYKKLDIPERDYFAEFLYIWKFESHGMQSPQDRPKVYLIWLHHWNLCNSSSRLHYIELEVLWRSLLSAVLGTTDITLIREDIRKQMKSDIINIEYSEHKGGGLLVSPEPAHHLPDLSAISHLSLLYVKNTIEHL